LSPGEKKRNQPRAGHQTALKTLSRRRRWLFRFVLLLLPLLLFGVLEGSLRLGGYGYDPHLFKHLKIGSEDFFVQNEDFSLRFFPKEIVRNPGPVRFPVRKAPGTFRIFILGESAAMGDPAPSFAPDRYLEMLLREKHPGMEFEVVNLAFTAINSHVILPIARECAAREGDLWIVYMGNNEMVGPYGAVTVFGSQAASLEQVRLVTALQQWRTGQWLMEMRRKFRGSDNQAAAWGGMGMFLRNQIPPDSPLKETVYRNFQKNLDDIVRAGIKSGAKVLLNSVAVNLKDCPPFAAWTNSLLSAVDRAQFDQLYARGLQAAAREEFAGAERLFAQAASLDAKSAELQFHWAECLLAQTNLAAAQDHFQLACDYDSLPFRADSRINAAIQAEREKVGSQSLIYLDTASVLAAGNSAGICGQETFFEHVHFDFDARYRLGRAWAEQIQQMLPGNATAWISQAVCEEKLGLSDWNRAQALHSMVERMQLPPLSSQANNAERRNALEARMVQLRARTIADNAASTQRGFLKLLENRQEDFFLHQNFAVFLELVGDAVAAAAEWQRYRELLPQDSLGYFQAGRLLIAQQRYAEAESSLRIALAIRPGRTDAWIELGNALALQQKYTEALVCYETALKQDPQNSQTHLRRGKVLARMNRHAEAMDSYRAAIQLNPTDGMSRRELGLELVAAGKADAAGAEFGEAARLIPDNVAARFDYGAWLLKQNRRDEAQREFEAVLRLEPGNPRAQQNLAHLRGPR
jgi:tetratricopeptide (TPR) repeat protein